jgi:mRNA interferase YafQ
MSGGNDRDIVIRPVDGAEFKRKYRSLRDSHSRVRDAMTAFNEIKRKIPPEPLPRGMKDHKLKGALKDLRECHLAPNILLTYKVVDNVILLVDICCHDDLK